MKATYEKVGGEWLVSVRSVAASFSALARANVVCELQHGHGITEPLAVLALLECDRATGGLAVASSLYPLAAEMLVAGWGVGEVMQDYWSVTPPDRSLLLEAPRA